MVTRLNCSFTVVGNAATLYAGFWRKVWRAHALFLPPFQLNKIFFGCIADSLVRNECDSVCLDVRKGREKKFDTLSHIRNRRRQWQLGSGFH